MFKQKFVLEVKGKEDRVYSFQCDPQSPLGELHDAVFTMQKVILNKMQEQHKKDEAPKEDLKDECPKECPKECDQQEEKK